MPQRMTTEDWIKKAKSVHGNRYDYSNTEYVSSGNRVVIGCSHHGEFEQVAKSHLTGRGCPECGKKSKIKSISDTRDNWIKKAKSAHGDKYDYSGVVYRNSKSKVKIKCPYHGEFQQVAKSHLTGRGCPECSPTDRPKMDQNDLIDSFIKTHGGKYNYDLVDYEGHDKKIKILCPEHGVFEQSPVEHKRGRGCRECGRVSGGLKRRSDNEDFIKKAKSVHGDKYDYSRVEYVTAYDPVEIIVRETGCSFFQKPYNHLSGHGSLIERNENISHRSLLTRDEFVERAKSIHGDKYDYSNITYKGSRTPVKIGCHKHGIFETLPMYHLQSNGCPKCATKVSLGETQIYLLCKSLTSDEIIQSDRSTIHPFELDIYIPSKKLAIEYCGLVWHSDRFTKDSKRHLRKHEACERLGIRLVTIFEDEWLLKRELVEATLRHFMGKSEPGIGARKARIEPIGWKTAKDFLDQHHLLGSGSPTAIRVGAYHGDTLIGVMTFGAPSDERGQTKMVEMKRFVTDKKNHPGLGSRMFTWSIRQYGFEQVMAFVDRRWFSGSFKFISGFQIDSVTHPTLYWTDFTRRYKRRFVTKKQLSALEKFQHKDMTKSEMLKKLGYHRIWDCGKIKLVWKNGFESL